MEKDRFFKIAEIFDRVAQKVVPQYDFLQDEVIRFLDYSKGDTLCIFDLGAGSGIFLEKILLKYPNSIGYWIDYSPDFQRVAKQRLDKFGDRVKYVLCEIEKDWDKLIETKPDLIFSMLTIHHLEDLEKETLYKKSHKMLKENGWFVNIDEMETLNKQGYMNSLLFKGKYALNAAQSIDPETEPFYKSYLEYQKQWKESCITNFYLPKKKGDDLHAPFIDQVKWLENIGYKNTDIIIKYHLMHVIVGQK